MTAPRRLPAWLKASPCHSFPVLLHASPSPTCSSRQSKSNLRACRVACVPFNHSVIRLRLTTPSNRSHRRRIYNLPSLLAARARHGEPSPSTSGKVPPHMCASVVKSGMCPCQARERSDVNVSDRWRVFERDRGQRCRCECFSGWESMIHG